MSSVKFESYISRPFTLKKILERIFENHHFESSFDISQSHFDSIVEVIENDYNDENQHIDNCLYSQIYHLCYGEKMNYQEIQYHYSKANFVRSFMILLVDILHSCEIHTNPFSQINNTACDLNLIMNHLLFVYYVHFASSRFHKTKSARNTGL